jgi:hypothetical protein
MNVGVVSCALAPLAKREREVGSLHEQPLRFPRRPTEINAHEPNTAEVRK